MWDYGQYLSSTSFLHVVRVLVFRIGYEKGEKEELVGEDEARTRRRLTRRKAYS